MQNLIRATASAALALVVLSANAQTSATHKAQHAGTVTRKGAAQPAAPNGPPTAVIDTTAGKLTCTLFPDKSPKGVENFVGLATGTKDWTDPKSGKKKHGVPLYNGTIFHRVIPNFMIQGGDPEGTGSGGPGYSIPDEIAPDLKFDVPGKLAYANSGPNTNGSQFFITEVPTPHLDGHYVILGQCDNATVDLVRQIARRPRDERNDRPFEPVTINRITVSGVNLPAATKKTVTKKTSTTTTKKSTKKTPPPQ
jgi:cyclophilin family peptidyl-prolyl cis-trans isomerase